MATEQEHRVDELIEHGELLLDLYLSGAGGHRNSEPWYTILSAGIDFLTSMSLAAINTGTGQLESRKLMEDDLSFFFRQLFGDTSPCGPVSPNVILYPTK